MWALLEGLSNVYPDTCRFCPPFQDNSLVVLYDNLMILSQIVVVDWPPLIKSDDRARE